MDVQELYEILNEAIEVQPQYHFNVERMRQVQDDWGESMTIV